MKSICLLRTGSDSSAYTHSPTLPRWRLLLNINDLRLRCRRRAMAAEETATILGRWAAIVSTAVSGTRTRPSVPGSGSGSISPASVPSAVSLVRRRAPTPLTGWRSSLVIVPRAAAITWVRVRRRRRRTPPTVLLVWWRRAWGRREVIARRRGSRSEWVCPGRARWIFAGIHVEPRLHSLGMTGMLKTVRNGGQTMLCS